MGPILIFLLIGFTPPLEANFISHTKPQQDSDTHKLSTVINSFTYAGDFHPAADLLELCMEWDINPVNQDRLINSLIHSLEAYKGKLLKELTSKDIATLASDHINNLVKKVKTAMTTNHAVLQEILWKEARAQPPHARHKRSFFNNILDLFIGWSSFSNSKRLDRISDALVRTTKAIKLDETALHALQNYTNQLVTLQAEHIHVENTLDNLDQYSEKVLEHYKSKTGFLKAIARNQLDFGTLSFSHYAKITHTIDSLVDSMNLTNLELDLSAAPFAVSTHNKTLHICAYLTVQPTYVPRLSAFHPHEAIFRFNGTLLRTDKPSETLIALSEDHAYVAALSFEDYAACRRDKARIICYDFRTLHRRSSSCSISRYLKNFEDILENCNLTPVPEDSAFWLIQDQNMMFIGDKTHVPLVNKSCPAKTDTQLHQRHVSLEHNCVYSTDDLLLYADTKLTLRLDVDQHFHNNFKLHELKPMHKKKLLDLHIGNVDVYDTDDFASFNPLRTWWMYLILGLFTTLLTGLSTIAICVYRHRKMVLKLLESVNPEMAEANVATSVVKSVLDPPTQPQCPPNELCDQSAIPQSPTRMTGALQPGSAQSSVHDYHMIDVNIH